MNENTFSTRQALTLSTMFLIGQTLVMYNGTPAMTDIWISILLAFVAAIPMALLAARLTNVFPGKNLYDLQLDFFGPVIGKATAFLYVLFSLHVGSLIIRDMASFIQITALIDTPLYVTVIFIITLCIYTVKAGINTLARYAAIALPVFLLIMVGITVLSATLWGNFSHLPPVLYNGFAPVFKSAVDISIIPFSDLMMLPFVLQPLKKHRKAMLIYIGSTAISAALLLMVFIRNMLVLGANFAYSQYFPSYVVVSLIDIADFLQRLEVAAGAVLFMGAYAKIAIYLYVASLGLSKVLGFGDYRKFAAPMGLLMAAMTLFAYPNIMVNLVFAMNVYPYYQLPFHFFLPMVVWLMAEWKRRKLKREGRLPEPPPAAEETPVARQEGSLPQNPDGPPPDRPQPAGQ